MGWESRMSRVSRESWLRKVNWVSRKPHTQGSLGAAVSVLVSEDYPGTGNG